MLGSTFSKSIPKASQMHLQIVEILVLLLEAPRASQEWYRHRILQLNIHLYVSFQQNLDYLASDRSIRQINKGFLSVDTEGCPEKIGNCYS